MCIVSYSSRHLAQEMELEATSSRQFLSVEDVNTRIDDCVRTHAIWEKILWGVLTFMVLVGIAAFSYGLTRDNNYLIGLSVGETGLVTWPTLRLIELYKRRVALSVVPAISAMLSERDAAREIHALIQMLVAK
jgi:hypothetical protein